MYVPAHLKFSASPLRIVSDTCRCLGSADMERMEAEKDHLHKLVKRLELRLTDREKQAKSLEIASGDGHAASGDAYFIPNIREQHLEAEEDEEASIFARRADNDGEDESSSDTESTSHRLDNTPVATDGGE